MQKQRHYSHPPIKEAIIDFKVTFSEDLSFNTLSTIQTQVQSLFPTSETIQINTLMFTPDPSIPVNATAKKNGLAFTSKDQRKKLQVTLSGFTFSYLAPYSSWDRFLNEARQLWNIYANTCKPSNVIRADVRFVNQINIPLQAQDKINLSDYLRTVPEVSDALPKGVLSSYFMQLQIPQTDLNCMLIINEALVPQVKPDFMSVILDIDLYREQQWEYNDEDIWKFLGDLHLRKNQVFESSITEKTRRLFD